MRHGDVRLDQHAVLRRELDRGLLVEGPDELTALANKFVSGGGGDGKSFPDLFTQDAISDCQKGNYAKGIPVLEKRLRSSRVTLPSR